MLHCRKVKKNGVLMGGKIQPVEKKHGSERQHVSQSKVR